MQPDILGEPYQCREIPLGTDDQGEVVATLVSRRALQPTGRAVLYVHGFVDYFFQTHLADFYVDRGYDFYALDLRKYGRSLRPHQTPWFARSMEEYFAEVDAAVEIIRTEDGHGKLLLNAHSTGGLIAALWADRVRGKGLADALFLNSPFFDLNAPWVMRRVVARAAGGLGARRPYQKLPIFLETLYPESIHRDHRGDWTFDPTWKPVARIQLQAGWLRAIVRAQGQLRRGLHIDVPVLVACSTETYRRKSWHETIKSMDAVLDLDHIARGAPLLGRHVTLVRIDGGVHDLVLSGEKAREQVFAELDRWLTTYLP